MTPVPDKAPRILQFCHGYDGPFLDCARQYATLFRGTPYKVTTVYLTGQPSPEAELGSDSDEVVFLGYRAEEVRGLKLKAIWDLHRLVAGRSFQLCIAHRFKPIYVTLLATQLPVIGVHHAFGDYQRPGRKLVAHLFRKRLSLLGVSHAVRDDIRRCLPRWPEERIATLYNRVDLATLHARQWPRATARQLLGLPAEAWVIGNVGRLHPDKDQATLLRAFAVALPRLPAGSLLAIMGAGRLENRLKTLAETLGIAQQVRFMGVIPEARCYFKAFDSFALTSDHEPFGMVLLEAMAAGLAPIATDCGGAREVVAGIGQLFSLGDVQQLADILVRQPRQSVDSYSLQQHLQVNFTDTAARRQFWALPMVAPLLGGWSL